MFIKIDLKQGLTKLIVYMFNNTKQDFFNLIKRSILKIGHIYNNY